MQYKCTPVILSDQTITFRSLCTPSGIPCLQSTNAVFCEGRMTVKKYSTDSVDLAGKDVLYTVGPIDNRNLQNEHCGFQMFASDGVLRYMMLHAAVARPVMSPQLPYASTTDGRLRLAAFQSARRAVPCSKAPRA